MMTRMTSLTLATAALALSTSAAIAQDTQSPLPPESALPGIEGSAEVEAATDTRVTPDAEIDAEAGATAETAADTRLTPESQEAQAIPVIESPDETRLTTETEVGTHAGMQGEEAVAAAVAALSNGGPALALSTDGEVLGHIRNATVDDRGMPVFSLLLDPSLGLEVETVTYGGEATVVGEGEIALQLSRAQLVGAVEDWIQTRN